jgi:hypothetical protein
MYVANGQTDISLDICCPRVADVGMVFYLWRIIDTYSGIELSRRYGCPESLFVDSLFVAITTRASNPP